MYKKYIKRLLDIIISLCGLVVLSPFMILIVILIRMDSKGNALFKQKRLGINQNEFTIYKFRTMVQNAYNVGGTNVYDGDPRITKVGNFLRKTSLDETPQLINIIKGEMSIIGPRPILKEEFKPFKSLGHSSRRYEVRPGLFCTVDVDYRATATREIQFDMDAKYVNDLNMKLDCLVFFKTLITVLKRKNVYKGFQHSSSDEEKIK
jgi:lipopolysaccharide/colanic/teichoic acid biosynthesis glycosyltransferase